MSPEKRTSFLKYAVLALCFLCALPVHSSQRVALVIGNANYKHAPLLANPINDAVDMSAALERLGFAVTRLENLGWQNLHRSLREFSRAAEVSEVALVFYAGHGIEVDRKNYLIPVDAELASDRDVDFEAVSLDLVLHAVKGASEMRLVILDACRDNPFAAKMQSAGATRSLGRGLARVEPAVETLVAYAAKEGTVASDGSGRNSPYSKALLTYLEEPGLEVGLMFRKVRDSVLGATGGRQEPFLYGSLSSEGFYLSATPAEGVAASATPAESDDSGTLQIQAQMLAADREFWESIKDSDNPSDYLAYTNRFKNGIYVELARIRIENLQDGSLEIGSSGAFTEETSQPSAEEGLKLAENSLGLTRAERRQIQHGLNELGFDAGLVDGLFGNKSRRAIRLWQQAKGKESTGYLNQSEADALVEEGRGSVFAKYTKLLGREPSVDYVDDYGNTDLHQAASKNAYQVAELLIAHGADVNVRNKVRWTPLHQAVSKNAYQVVEMLVAHGADVNVRNNIGRMPLHQALDEKHFQIAELLIEHGADVNARDNGGSAPLLHAITLEKFQIAELLIKHGADVNARDNDGDSPLHQALDEKHFQLAELLIEHGADVNWRAKFGITPLHLAALHNAVRVAELLIVLGADVNAQDDDFDEEPPHGDGNSPLHFAASVRIAELLIANGADVDGRAKSGFTPLTSAAGSNAVQIAELLIAHGADVNAQSDNGWTPLNFAEFNNADRVAKLLIAHGAQK